MLVFATKSADKNKKLHLNNPLSKKYKHWATPLTCWLRTYFYGQPLTAIS